MKNLLDFVKIFALALVVIFPAICHAEDVWVNTKTNPDGKTKTDVYIMTETIREDYNDRHFSVCEKTVSNVVEPSNPSKSQEIVTITEFHFIHRNGRWYCKWFFNGIEIPDPWQLVTKDTRLDLFNACKPYVRLVREYPIK